MVRILLVEDHVLVRQSIRAFLEDASYEVVGEAGTGIEAVQLTLKMMPDLVIMDIHLPEMSGIEATRRIRRQFPEVRIIALTAYNEPAYQRALLNAGANGYVLKTAEFSELLSVIQQVTIQHINLLAIDHSFEKLHPATSLTDREIEVMEAVGRGWTNKQIAAHLNISDRTVQVHLQAAYQKLGVANRTEAALHAIALGIITTGNGTGQ
jgi:DNA-binding NarL/FixJ family response regulator